MESLLTRRRWLTPVILFGLALLLLQPAVLPDDRRHALDGHDFTGNFYPLYSFTAEQVRAGALPLWNPRQFAGFPVAGNPQAAIFYPGTWLIWGLNAAGASVPRAMGVMVVAHVFLAAWGMALLARRFGVTHTAALAAAVIYAMSGWAAARVFAGHYTILTVYAWIPFVLAGTHRALERRTVGALLPPVAALGMAALAGHPQMVLYAALGMAVLWGYTVYSAGDARSAAWAGLWRVAAIGVGGIVLGAALLIPTAELVLQTARTATTLDFVNKFHLSTQQITTLVFPFLYGNPNVPPSRYWGVDFFEEVTAYTGLFSLAALALIFRVNERCVVFWLALVVIGFALALGADGVLFALLVRWLPGFDFFRSPGRFLYFVTLGLAGITALFITHLQAATPDRRRATLAPALRVMPYLAVLFFAGGAFFSGWFASTSPVEPMPVRAAQTAGVFSYAAVMALATWGVLAAFARADDNRTLNAALVLALLLIVWDVWRVALPVITASDVTDTPLWDGAVVNVPTDNAGRVVGFADPNDYYRNAVNNASITGHLHLKGYDPLEIASYAALERAANHNPNHPLYQLLGLRYVFSWEPRADAGWELIGIADGGIYYENPDPFPRAWVATAGELQPNDDAARNLMASGEIDLRETVILSAPLDCELGDGATNASITTYAPNRVTIDVSGAGGVLVLSDQYYPGWQATIDGERAEIRRAYTALRAVCVPSGDHTVMFRYRPLSVLVGAVVSGAGWLLLGAASVLAWRRHDEQP